MGSLWTGYLPGPEAKAPDLYHTSWLPCLDRYSRLRERHIVGRHGSHTPTGNARVHRHELKVGQEHVGGRRTRIRCDNPASRLYSGKHHCLPYLRAIPNAGGLCDTHLSLCPCLGGEYGRSGSLCHHARKRISVPSQINSRYAVEGAGSGTISVRAAPDRDAMLSRTGCARSVRVGVALAAISSPARGALRRS